MSRYSYTFWNSLNGRHTTSNHCEWIWSNTWRWWLNSIGKNNRVLFRCYFYVRKVEFNGFKLDLVKLFYLQRVLKFDIGIWRSWINQGISHKELIFILLHYRIIQRKLLKWTYWHWILGKHDWDKCD